jgi:hypothetical protein
VVGWEVVVEEVWRNDTTGGRERERGRERDRERERTRTGKAPRGATRGKRSERKKAHVAVAGRGWQRRKGGGEREDGGGCKKARANRVW